MTEDGAHRIIARLLRRGLVRDRRLHRAQVLDCQLGRLGQVEPKFVAAALIDERAKRFLDGADLVRTRPLQRVVPIAISGRRLRPCRFRHV